MKDEMTNLRCMSCKTDVAIDETHETCWDVWCPTCNRNISRIFWIELKKEDNEKESEKESETESCGS
jgi:DNA-directed RNA polymerase subunit RPC12/RpoP